MTMVQWWCSGVVLNRVFMAPRAAQGGPRAEPVPKPGAAGQSSAKSTSPDTGKAMDLAA